MAGASVIPHVFPGLSGQLAGAFANVSAVEIILPETGADPIHEVFSTPLEIDNGELVIDTSPGHGISLDWDAVTACAATMTTVGAPAPSRAFS